MRCASFRALLQRPYCSSRAGWRLGRRYRPPQHHAGRRHPPKSGVTSYSELSRTIFKAINGLGLVSTIKLCISAVHHGCECCCCECFCLLADGNRHCVVRGLSCILPAGHSATDDGPGPWGSQLCGVSKRRCDGTLCRGSCCWQYAGSHRRFLTRHVVYYHSATVCFSFERINDYAVGWMASLQRRFLLFAFSRRQVYAVVGLFQVSQSGILFGMRSWCDSVV